LQQQGLSDVAREAVGTVAAATQVLVMHAEVAVLEAMAVAGSCVRNKTMVLTILCSTVCTAQYC